MAGAHIATIPYKVIEQLAMHPLTDQGIENLLLIGRKRLNYNEVKCSLIAFTRGSISM